MSDGKILIIEDNAKNRMLIRDVLEYHGYNVLEAEDGAAGIAAAMEWHPDLILMDIQMPVIDGMTAVQLLRNAPETKEIKMIALTSFAMKGDREKFLAAGFDDYIAKPIDTRKLSEWVEQWLVKSQPTLD